MNKLIIALSLACASACVFAADNAIPKVTSNEWFTVASGHEAGGSFNKTDLYDGSKYVIDSELESPVTFTAETAEAAKDMTEVSFNLDTSIVPADARPDLSTKGKVAFAASEVSGDTKAYFAWLGVENDDKGWVQLTGAEVKGDNESYKLDVTFDNRDGGKKVQFKVDGVALTTTDGSNWLSYAADGSPATELAIDLVGSGSITSICGNQLTITAEIVVVDGGVITIKEEDMEKFRATAPQGTSVDAFIASNAREAFGSDKFATGNVSVGAAYALGLVADDGTGSKMAPVDGGVLVAKALAEANVAGVKLGLKVTPPKGTGATITYNILKNNETYKATLSQAEFDSFIIPTEDLGAGLKVFKVQAVVTPAAE